MATCPKFSVSSGIWIISTPEHWASSGYTNSDSPPTYTHSEVHLHPETMAFLGDPNFSSKVQKNLKYKPEVPDHLSQFKFIHSHTRTFKLLKFLLKKKLQVWNIYTVCYAKCFRCAISFNPHKIPIKKMYYSHFVEDDSEAQNGKMPSQRNLQYLSYILNPVSWVLEFIILWGVSYKKTIMEVRN